MVAESLFGVSATKRITETVSRCLYKGIFDSQSYIADLETVLRISK